MEEKRSIWIPMRKNFETNNYEAILSDTSIDRDDEKMSPELIRQWGSNPNKYIPMLMDHQNKMLNLLGKWTNAQVMQKGEHYALKMEPKWFLSNPNAKVIKDMMDEGAEPGLSIGAIPKKSSTVDYNGMKIKQWDEAELIEASIVPIGSNRGSYMRIAKSFNLGGEKMTDEIKKEEEIQNETPEEVKDEVPKSEEKTEEETEKVTEETEDKELKSLKEELNKLQKEVLKEKINALKSTKTVERKVELKALSENTATVEDKPIVKDLDVFEQMALLKGAKLF